MSEKKMDKLREKLYFLLNEKADYDEVLKVSQELDEYISEFTFEKLNSTSLGESSIKKDEVEN